MLQLQICTLGVLPDTLDILKQPNNFRRILFCACVCAFVCVRGGPIFQTIAPWGKKQTMEILIF